jgi:hypothetical protein
MADFDIAKSLEAIGFQELLTVMCPGAVVLASTSMWLPFLEQALRDGVVRIATSTTASIFGLLVSYALGLVLHAWAASGYSRFVVVRDNNWRNLSGGARLVWSCELFLTGLLHGARRMQHAEGETDTRLEIVDFVRDRFGESVVGLLEPNDFLYVFRTLARRDLDRHDDAVFAEANILFHRRGFSQGVSLASVIVAVEAAIALVAIRSRDTSQPPAYEATLLLVLGSAVIVSLLLRDASTRLHSDERVFSYSLLRALREPTKSQTSPVSNLACRSDGRAYATNLSERPVIPSTTLGSA